jgi:hypothetical protein
MAAMHRKNDLRGTSLAAITLSLALTIGLLDSQSALADSCGGYCKARAVRAICHDAVTAKGLTGLQRHIEFEKCKVDPMTHRQIEEQLTDGNVNFD